MRWDQAKAPTIATVLLLSLACVAGGAAGTHFAPTAIGLALASGSALLVWKPELSVPVTVLFACTATPAFFPQEFDLGGVTLLSYEPTLVVAALWVAATLPTPRTCLRSVALLATVVMTWSAYGLINGSELGPLMGDVRPLIDFGIAFFVAGHLVGTRHLRPAVTALVASLWISAGLTLAASLAGFRMAGREEEASLGLDVSTNAVRYLTAATFPALAALSMVTALLVIGRMTIRSTWMYWAPSIVILVLAFSRNNLLGLGVAGLFAVLCARNEQRFTALLRRTVATLAIGGILIVTGPLLVAQLPSDSWAVTQLAAYENRVFGGIQAQTLAKDPSALYRLREDTRLWRAIDENPILGHGFGYAYKPAEGLPGSFLAATGPYYAHQFYLWIWVKTGLIGACAVLWVFVAPVLYALRRPTPILVALGATVVGFLAVSFVAPMPTTVPANVQMGAVLGILVAAVWRDSRKGNPRDLEPADVPLLDTV